MTWEICRKELLKNFQSFRFFALFAVAVFLSAANLFLLSTSYTEALQIYDRNMEQSRRLDKTMGVEVHRRPNPLSFVAEGGDKEAIGAFRISLSSGIVPKEPDRYGANQNFPSFQSIDWVFILKILFSLFAILLTFDAISGEKEHGTLSLMCSNSVSRVSIIMGKYLGALITVMIPASISMLISTIIAGFVGNTVLTMESMFDLALVAAIALTYVSLFALLGIVISSTVHRSSVSLLLLLSIWIILIIVVPNLAGLIAESISDVMPEYEFAKESSRIWNEGGAIFQKRVETKGLKAMEELRDEWGEVLTAQTEKKMKMMDSYVNTIYAREDLALNISRVSPASAFELASSDMVNAGIMSQRRFDKAARKYYDLYEDYVRQKTGEVQKYMYWGTTVEIDGKRVEVSRPPIKPLPKDTSDFPVLPEANLSISESILSASWNILLLFLWNIVLLLLSYLCFLRYDVR